MKLGSCRKQSPRQPRSNLIHITEVRNMKLKIRTILSLFILAAAAQAVAAQGTVRNWTIDGVKREALVFAPKPATNDVRHPVVFAWHGHGGNMQGTAQQMHIQTEW